MSQVGQRKPRVDAYDKVTGRAKYGGLRKGTGCGRTEQ